MQREQLKSGTYVRFPGGECYQVNELIGAGGSSLLYSANKMIIYKGKDGLETHMHYALKECFPYSEQYEFIRLESGEVAPKEASKDAAFYLRYVSWMQAHEGQITADIYSKEAVRMIPMQKLANVVEISTDEGKTFHSVRNTFTVMTSLEQKGESAYIWKSKMNRPPVAVFRAIRETLIALREVHRAGYLHLDMQEGNVFLAGEWRDQSLTCFLIDFGSARELMEDGYCDVVGNQPIFSSAGYRAPEILEIMRGKSFEIRLGKEADLYSVGYLLLYLLTGKHYSEEEMEVFRSSYERKYLTRKNLEELRIPEHLEDLTQHILTKALEEKPENRYHSTDEMLKDVDRLLDELVPHHSKLQGFQYDAYILYDEKNRLHKKAAEALQKGIEHFKVSGQRRIRRVFLDSAELSVDQNANRQIVDALGDSGYLIIIGNDTEGETIWNAGEVQYFLKTHDSSRILPVVVEQKDESDDQKIVKFKGRERYLSYAAAVYGQTEAEILKKIRKDAVLRIVAPILGVPYDGLVQRYRTYRRKKIGSIVGVVSIVAIGFLSYTVYQKYQIQIEHRLASRNRAQNLCTQALKQYEQGDKTGALQTVLLPSNEEKNTKSAIIPEQMYALNTVLNSYASGQERKFTARDKITQSFVKVTYSEDKSYGYGIDSKGMLTVFTCKDGKTIWEGDSGQIERMIQESDTSDGLPEALGVIQLAYPIEKNQVLIVMEHAAVVFNSENQKVEQAFPLEVPMAFKADIYVGYENLFAYVDSSQNLDLYDVTSGQKTAVISQEWMSGLLGKVGEYADDPKISRVDFSQDGVQMVISTDAGVVLYDRNSGEGRVLTTSPGEHVSFTGNGNVLVLEYEEQTQAETASENFWKDTMYHWTYVIYDAHTGETISRSEKETGYVTDEKGQCILPLKTGNDDGDTWIHWIRGDLYISQTGTGAQKISFASNIIGVQAYTEEAFLVGLSDGSIVQVELADMLVKRQVYQGDFQMEDFLYDQMEDRLILKTEDGIVFCERPEDSGMKQQVADQIFDAYYVISDMEEKRADQQKYQCVWFADTRVQNKVYGFWLEKNAVALYTEQADSPAFTYTCDETWEIQDLQVKEVQGQLCAVILETEKGYGNDSAKVRIFSVDSKELVADYSVEGEAGEELKAGSDWIYTPDVEGLYFRNTEKLFYVDLKKQTIQRMDESEETDGQILEIVSVNGGKEIEVLNRDGNQIYLAKYSTEDGKLQGKQEIGEQTTSQQSPAMTVSSDELSLAVYHPDGQIIILDTATGKTQQTIECGQKQNLQLRFFEQDQCILGVDKEAAWIYDLKSGKLVSTYALEENQSGIRLSADQNGSYFTLKDRSVSEDMNTDVGLDDRMRLQVFYVENQQIYPFAEVDQGYKLADSTQIYSVYKDGMGFSSGEMYDFAELYEKAEEELESLQKE